MHSTPSVKVPVGLQARHWYTIRPERTVLVVAHHVTSLLRLVDMLTVFDSDTRVQVVFSWNGSDPFIHGIDECLQQLGAMVIPWHQAINTEFDLAIAANHGGLTEISAELVILSHGAGYTKNSPGDRRPETGDRTVFGLSAEWLLYNGQPIASALVLAHESEAARLAAITPAAASIGVVAGDPAYDRMVVSTHLRMHYRQALRVAPEQKLITVCTTWSERSLLGSWPELFRQLTACLPRDEYRIAALVHPNIWHGHGPRQVKDWVADAQRGGLTLIGPTEGWQAVLLASDLIIGDYGASTCYGAALDLPVLLAAYPPDEVAAGSVGELLGTLATRLNRHETLRTQIDHALVRHESGRFAPLRDLMTTYPGEAIERLRVLCYRHMRLSVPGTLPVTPVIPPELIAIPAASLTADHVVCTATGPTDYSVARFPAGIAIDRSAATYLDRAFLIVHENHPQQALLNEAPVVLASDTAIGQHADDVLTAVFRRLPAAQVAAVTIVGGLLITTRRRHRITMHGNDIGLAAAVVYEWLLTGTEELPGELHVVSGSRRTVFTQFDHEI